VPIHSKYLANRSRKLSRKLPWVRQGVGEPSQNIPKHSMSGLNADIQWHFQRQWPVEASSEVIPGYRLLAKRMRDADFARDMMSSGG
jgi:hypothetical protein